MLIEPTMQNDYDALLREARRIVTRVSTLSPTELVKLSECAQIAPTITEEYAKVRAVVADLLKSRQDLHPIVHIVQTELIGALTLATNNARIGRPQQDWASVQTRAMMPIADAILAVLLRLELNVPSYAALMQGWETSAQTAETAAVFSDAELRRLAFLKWLVDSRHATVADDLAAYSAPTVPA